MKETILRAIKYFEVLLLPIVFFSAYLLKQIRFVGISRFPLCRSLLIRIGVFPVRNHYYEPKFDYRDISKPLSEDRALSGIDWNIREQIELLSTLKYANELRNIPTTKTNKIEFYLNNGAFESGDAEYWYQLLRHIKPNKIFEIGSGYSTLMAISALCENHNDDPNYSCHHVCIEPYSNQWLEKTGTTVVRKLVEDVDIQFFSELCANDILFIDSSHIIRPQGDLVFEYLELLPTLNKGVIVHIHDIFSPKNYPKEWLEERVLFWNEQYLLEAFITHNSHWKIIGALNYLHHNHYENLKVVCPYLEPEREPGSFYIKKIK